ncbi:WSCD family member GA21586-like [Haliotis rufescens]|uniref:WSCD family member GA21586-like n=1 Tax=Haliotis rufescens TaxID=6454 RepID=UPI001EAFE4DC|nr:WSCD family member GA21586-like [Haliotis rufescens]
MRITCRKCFLIVLLSFLSILMYLRSSTRSSYNIYRPRLAEHRADKWLSEHHENHQAARANLTNSIQRKDTFDNTHNSSDCRTGIRFSYVPLSLTALASFPGTGNTWVRHLIERMTGLATGSVHHDRSLLDVFCGEERADHSVVAIKTHLRYPDNTFTPDKVLLIIRNPYHAIVANFNRVFSGQHTGTAPIKAWQKYWESESSRFRRAWLPFYRSWLQADHVMPIVYENIQANLEKELARILSFLGVVGDVRRAVVDPEGSFHRQPIKFASSLQQYTVSQRRRVNRIIDHTQTIFSKTFSYESYSYNLTEWKL